MVQAPNVYRIDMPEGSTTDKAGNLINSQADGYLHLDRRNYVLGRMLANGKISQQEYDDAMASPITPNITNRSQGCQNATGAEFFCEYVRTILLNDPPSAPTTTRARRTCAAAA
jgi:membrane peptidoglycan carboxypeptidase